MKLRFLLPLVLFCGSCIPKDTTNRGSVTFDSNLHPEEKLSRTLSQHEIKSVCKRLANFRSRLDGIMDPRVSDEILLRNEVGGYGYIELLYIVRRYGQEIAMDQTYEDCVKYLYIFNDGEYAGSIDEVLPYSQKFRSRSQEWLIKS